MNRQLGAGVLIVCFSISNVNLSFATEMVDVAPIIVQPYGTQDLNQQGLDQDRINRDEEIEIQNLMEENKRLIQDVMAGKQDQGLAKIGQTMSNYQNDLYSRDQARILANGVSPRYASLVALTEDADAMTEDRGDLENKNTLLAQKYQMLSQLKDEMVSLNDKLRNQDSADLNQKDKIIGAYKDLARDQQRKIQLLVQRLDEMDHKISHFDEIIAKKDQQIESLTSDLAEAQSTLQQQASLNKNQSAAYDNYQAEVKSLKNQIQEQVDDLKTKDQMLKEQEDQIAVLQKQPVVSSAPANTTQAVPAVIVNNQPQAYAELQDEITGLRNRLHKEDMDLEAKNATLQALNQSLPAANGKAAYYQLASQKNKSALLQVQSEISGIKDDLSQQMKGYSQLENNVLNSKSEVSHLKQELSAKQTQVDLLKSELENRLSQENAQSQQAAQAEQDFKNQIQNLKSQIQEKEDDISKLKDNIQATQTDEANKETALQKEKNDSLQWLNQVLAAAKEKAEYYKLTSQKDRLAMLQLKNELSDIKDDLAQHMKDYTQFQNTILDLKNQVDRLTLQLSAAKDQNQRDAELQQDLKSQLQDKENQIMQLKTNIQSIQADQGNKEVVLQNAAAQAEDRIKLARQLIDLQEQEAGLIDEKSKLYSTEGSSFEQRTHDLQDKIMAVLASHHTHMADLRNHMQQLKDELSQKEGQVDSLNTNLQDKIGALKDQSVLDYEITDLKNQVDHLNEQLQDKETTISILNTQLQSGQESQAQAEVAKNQLADQQNNVDVLKQELENKIGQLKQATSTVVDYKAAQEKNKGVLESQIQALKVQLQDMENTTANLKSQLQSGQETGTQVDVLKQELADQENRMNTLESVLKTKIEEEKNQKVLEYQIQDLKSQLQDKENQINAIQSQLQSSQETAVQVDGLKQELSDAQNKVEILNHELANKDAQSDQMTLIISDYQKKLESKDSAYNEELGQVLSSKNDQARMEAEITDLNARLQDKEAQIIKIKKDMYDLQELTNTKDQDIQTKDLTLSMAQQKLMDEKLKEYQDKINGLQASTQAQVQVIADLRAELAQARQNLGLVPSSDEIEFLRTGLKKATAQLQEKDALLAQIKANAAEYSKEFKAQSNEFQSVKTQLQDALEELDHKKEDLKYKNMELVRFKELTTAKEKDLQDQVGVLSLKLEAANKKGKNVGNTVIIDHGDKSGPLQAQLDSANLQIRNLQEQLNQLTGPMKEDRLREKLKQALDKIDQQGQYINALVNKLHDAGQNVNLADLGGTH